MRRSNVILIASVAVTLIAGAASRLEAASAAFTPLGSTDVEIGTPIQFEISVAVTNLPGFDAADVIIGSDSAADLTFVYSPAWTAAFASFNTPIYDVGFYAQSVFVGGNNAVSVGASMVLGTVTIQTTGMAPGIHTMQVNHSTDGFSALTLGGAPETLFGFANFHVHRPVPAVSSWGLVVLSLSILVAGAIQLRFAKPIPF